MVELSLASVFHLRSVDAARRVHDDNIREILSPNGLRVWCFPLSGTPTHNEWSLLDKHETARAARFVFDRDRHRYVQAHATMRWLLGTVLGRSAASLEFTVDALGKPALDSTLHFNLSHGGELGALVISHEQPVGIDIEPWRPVNDALAVGATVFTELEMQGWSSASAAEVDVSFLRLWTRKEALLKAIGLGLSLDPKTVDIGLLEDQCTVEVDAGSQHWAINVASLDHHTDAALAVAWL